MPFTHAYTGSNPVRVTIRNKSGGLAQLGEHLPYKQRVGGSSPSSSTIKYTGSNPVRVTIRNKSGGLAQLGEHLPYKQRVGGSSPSSSNIKCRNWSIGRATDLYSVGCGFKSCFRHHIIKQYGGVAKWLNAADCKSALWEFGGSNPSPSTT